MGNKFLKSNSNGNGNGWEKKMPLYISDEKTFLSVQIGFYRNSVHAGKICCVSTSTSKRSFAMLRFLSLKNDMASPTLPARPVRQYDEHTRRYRLVDQN